LSVALARPRVLSKTGPSSYANRLFKINNMIYACNSP
jgi:hypothetical protein